MRFYISSALIFVVFSSLSQAQVTSATSSGRNAGMPDPSQRNEAQILKTIDDAGRYFKRALYNLQDNRRNDARAQFNESVETFLRNGVDIEISLHLFECYHQLIETIYQIEFPKKDAPPQIKSLSVTCGWNIDSNLADKIAKLSDNGSTNQRGFTEQKFSEDPSKIDEQKFSNSKNDTSSRRNVRIVRAITGDTVETLARRNGANPIEVAKFNGLFVTTKLDSGREIKIPNDFESSALADSSIDLKLTPEDEALILGKKPVQAKDGKVQAVMDYFNENLNDPYSMRFVRWSPISKHYLNGLPFWKTRVKFRAKNSFGAYILREWTFLIQKGRVVKIITQ
jgi:hypothetical protein